MTETKDPDSSCDRTKDFGVSANPPAPRDCVDHRADIDAEIDPSPHYLGLNNRRLGYG